MNPFQFLFGSVNTATDINPFPIPIAESDFVAGDVESIYTRILTDVLERTQGIPETFLPSLWDNCLGSEHQEGLVTLLSKAMSCKGDLFLVYNPALNFIRKATHQEQTQIKADYKEKGESSLGVYITFQNYKRTDFVKFYSKLEYCAIGGLWKQGNVSKSLQIKVSDFRGSIALTDKVAAQAQVQIISDQLKAGKDFGCDAKDSVETASPDMEPIKANLQLIAQKRSFYLGMPASYLSGEVQTSSLSDTGNADARAIERGLKNYFYSVIKPAVDGVFKCKAKFKAEDTNDIKTGLEALKTFEISSDTYMSSENKTMQINKLFGLDENEKGTPPDPNENPEIVVDPKADPKVPPGKEKPPVK